MATLKQFSLFDMLQYNNINLDILTETFNTYFYAKYLIKWAEYCKSLWGATGNIEAYLMGKVEGSEDEGELHGHVTAITVAPDSRRQGLARLLMNYLQRVSESHQGFFVDLFVRSTNTVAIAMYRTFGYQLYQQVDKYYSASADQPEENAYDMRKSLPRDKHRITSAPTHRIVKPNQLKWN